MSGIVEGAHAPETAAVKVDGGEPAAGSRQGLHGGRVPVVEMVAAMVLSLVDVILLKKLADLLVSDTSFWGLLSWFVAVGMTGAGIAAAVASVTSKARVWRWTLRGIWISIGVSLLVARALHGVFAGDEIRADDVVLAVFMFAAYLGTGAAIMAAAPAVLDGRRSELKSAARAETRARRRLGRLEGRYSALSQLAVRADRAVIQVDEDLALLEGRIRAHRNKMRARARDQILFALAAPAATTDVLASNPAPGAETH